MLRLLLLYPLVASILAPLPADEEPKPPTVEVFFNQDGEAVKEDVKGPPTASSFTYYPQNYATANFNSVGNVFRGAGQAITFEAYQDSDLILIEPDDALRAQLKLPKDHGLVATSVRVHGPAWLAGVRENDVLLTLDDAPLAKPGDLDEKLKQAGEKRLTLAVVRKGTTRSLKVRPQVKVSLAPVEQEETPSYWIGVNVSALEPALRAQLNLPENQGLLVTSVVEGGPAAKSDLKANDILLSVAGKPLNGQAGLVEIVQKNGEKPMAVVYLREGSRHTLSKLTPEKRTGGQTFKVEFVPGNTSNRFGTTVVRPGVVQNSPSDGWVQGRNGWVSGWTVKNVIPTPDASTKRIDEMSAEIKELRKAIDALTKALEDKK